MQYYQDLITDKSFKILKELKKKFAFVLIGGWAVFLYTKSLKSKDIDIIVDYNELDKMKADFYINKNERLKKYEIKTEEIDIDIYLPHFSNLKIPLEKIDKYTCHVNGFLTVMPEFLLILKQTAFLERQGSSKGEKDKIDIISLLNLDNFDFILYKNILKKHGLKNYKAILVDLVSSINEVKEINLNQYYYSKLKKKILKLLEN